MVAVTASVLLQRSLPQLLQQRNDMHEHSSAAANHKDKIVTAHEEATYYEHCY